MLMHHLNGGVKKGAFSQEEAERRFNAWKANKEAKVNAIKTSVANQRELSAKQRLEAEEAKNKAKAEVVAKKKAEAAAAAAAAQAEEAAPAADENEAPAAE